MAFSWGLLFTALGLYLVRDINQKHFVLETTQPHSKIHCNPTCRASLRFPPSLQKPQRSVRCSSRLGRTCIKSLERDGVRQTETTERNIHCERKTTGRKEATFRHHIMAMCLSERALFIPTATQWRLSDCRNLSSSPKHIVDTERRW